MAKERKSPQQKKQLEYVKDHFSSGFNSARGFRKGWRRKKAKTNREYRHKADELLASVKPGLDTGDAEAVSEDMTAPRFQKSVSRKRLKKIGVVSMGERVRDRLQRRDETAGRKVRQHEYYDHAAAEAVKTLKRLSSEKLLAVVNGYELMLQGSGQGLGRLMFSHDSTDQALRFLHAVNVGSGRELDALQRNPELCQTFRTWIQKADRIIAKTRRTQEEKQQEKEAARQRSKQFRKAERRPSA